MTVLFYLAQFVAPVIGLVGLAICATGLMLPPLNMDLVLKSLPLIGLGVIFRPRPGHPMARLLGMHQGHATATAGPGKAGPSSDDTEHQAFLRKVIEDNRGVLAHEPGDLPHHASAVKLTPCLPGNERRGRSWIGGAPMLPEEMPWPRANDAPMLFVAQIALDDLPHGIWGGLGPREGSLAFFLPSEGRMDKDMRVLHLTGSLAERSWPVVPHSFDFGTVRNQARKSLSEIGLPVAQHPPRFDVAIGHHETEVDGPRQRPAGDNLRSAIQTDYDPRTPAFCPFDRATARALLAGLIAGQRFMDGNRFIRLGPEERASRHAAIAAMQRLDANLAADPDVPFGPEEGEALVATLAAITIEVVRRDADGNARSQPPISIFDEDMALGEARAPFEILVQEAMRTKADSVPAPVRARYEALWRYDQLGEYAVMGGAPHEGFIYSRAQNPVFLLELPSSDLVGWMFGDVSHLGVFIAPEDLAAGQWTRAWGDIMN